MSARFACVAALAVALLAAVPATLAQPAVEGRVVNAETDGPVPGAHVLVAGTALGATTDRDGRFALAVPEDGLQFGPPQPFATVSAGPHLALASTGGTMRAAWEDGERIRLGAPQTSSAWVGDRPALSGSMMAITRGDSVLVVPLGGPAPVAVR